MALLLALTILGGDLVQIKDGVELANVIWEGAIKCEAALARVEIGRAHV